MMLMIFLMIPSLTCTAETVDEPEQFFQDDGEGFWMSYESGTKLANYIQELQNEVSSLENQVSTLELVLEEERKQVDVIIENKDSVIRAKDYKIKLQEEIIELRTQQVEDLKEINRSRSPGIFEKAGWAAGGAGIAAVLILLTVIF